MAETEWKRHGDGYQYWAEIEGVQCSIDAPYDDTVDYQVHVFLNHPRYRSTLSASAYGHARDWEEAKRKVERYAHAIARWCCGPTD